MARHHQPSLIPRVQGTFGFVYLVTIVGAAVYFVDRADGFWGVVLGLLKALVWPAFAVHRALDLLNL